MSLLALLLPPPHSQHTLAGCLQGRVVSWQITEVMRHGGGTSTIEPVPTASITFKTRRRLQFGQVLKLVGSHKSMGAWDCDRAPGARPAGCISQLLSPIRCSQRRRPVGARSHAR